MKYLSLVAWAILLFWGSIPAALAQTLDTDSNEELPSATGTADDLKIVPQFGVGYTTSGASHDGFGRFEAFIPLRQNPGSNLTFLEGRLLLDNDTNISSNLILGHRFYDSQLQRIFGGYFAYDSRNTDSNSFHQLAAGWESLGEFWDFRTNVYIPIGDTRQLVAENISQTTPVFSNPFFQGNFLVTSGSRERRETRLWEAAMTGLDVETGVKIVDLGKTGELRGYIGGYYYDAPQSDNILGWRSRLEARPHDNLRLGLSVQHDGTFGTNVVFSIGGSFPGNRTQKPGFLRENPDISLSSPETRFLRRLGESVNRQQQITIDEQRESELFIENLTLTATNPDTNQPYFFHHVSLGTGVGDGTFEHPFTQVQSAIDIAQTAHIVYVQFGDNPGIPAFTIPDGVSVLSTGPIQQITASFNNLTGLSVFDTGVMNVQLPLSGSGNLPTVTGTITLGNNTTLSGFAIANVDGNGIQGTNIQNVTIRDNQITNATRGGINLVNIGGTNIIRNNQITNSGGAGISAQTAGDSQQQLTLESNTISGSGQQGINLDNLSGTSLVRNNQITGSGAEGIFAQTAGNSQQQLTLASNTISGSSQPGIFLQASEDSQQTTTLSSNTIDSNSGQGIFIQASGNTLQLVNFDSNTINNTILKSDGSGGQGIFVQAAENAQQQLTLNNGTVNRSAGQGIFLQAAENAGQQLTINGGTVSNSGTQGIFAQASDNNQQQLTINGATVSDSAEQGFFLQGNGDTNQELNLNRTTIDNSAGQGVFIQANGNTTQRLTIQDSNISNTNVGNDGGGGQGIFVQGNGNVQQQLVLDNVTISDSVVQGIFLQGSEQAQQQFTINNSTVSNSTDQGIFLQASGDTVQDFTLENNTVSNSTGQGVFVQGNDNARQNFTVSNNTVSDSTDQGIFVQGNGNAQQNFTISDNTVLNSASQGIFVQASGMSEQRVTLSRNSVTNSTLDGILILANATLVTANVEFNILQNNQGLGFNGIMDGNLNFCLALNGNQSDRDLQVQRNDGIFAIVDRDNLQAINNNVPVNFVPDVNAFTDVMICP
ncbi:MAG: right-handed parallel beta-helix repeat-containing protein [Symploca sp. SIO2E6]|nr:right-handed parallel beta-helix repeat-containing protein [Symploca sp. SIO2E6]